MDMSDLRDDPVDVEVFGGKDDSVDVFNDKDVPAEAEVLD